MVTENLSTLKIHKLTQNQYWRELEAGNIDDNALYLTPDETIDLTGYATKQQVNAVIETVGTKISAPSVATVGQTIVVKEVDEDGKPVSWECTDVASGGSKEWRLLHNVELTEEVAANAGMEFDTTGCKEIIVRWICPKISNTTGFATFKINGGLSDNGGPFWNNKLCSTTATTDRSFRFEALGDSVALSPLWTDGGVNAVWWNGGGMFNTIDTLQLVHYGGTYPIGLKIIIWGAVRV